LAEIKIVKGTQRPTNMVIEQNVEVEEVEELSFDHSEGYFSRNNIRHRGSTNQKACLDGYKVELL
jgi:hypothetical protein